MDAYIRHKISYETFLYSLPLLLICICMQVRAFRDLFNEFKLQAQQSPSQVVDQSTHMLCLVGKRPSNELMAFQVRGTRSRA